MFLHDSMCGKINNTLLSKEMVNVEKVWAPTLPDVLYQIENMEENADVIAIHSMTNDLNQRNVGEITDLVADVSEKALLKAKKIVISSIISRDDDPLLNAKAAAVNANLKLIFINTPNVSLCINDNLNDKKFRVDKVHLSDRGVSRLANNLKYKLASALNITVKKKSRIDNHWDFRNGQRYEEDRFRY